MSAPDFVLQRLILTIHVPSVHYGLVYSVSTMIGGQAIELILDTGSSDFWAVPSNFSCVDYYTDAVTTQDACDFGPGRYDPTETFVKSKVPNQRLQVSYTDQTSISGSLGFDHLNISGLSVYQQIASVEQAKYYGDDVTSGLLGLGPAGGTSARSTIDNSIVPYKPFIETMFETYPKMPGVFSIAIARSTAFDSASDSLTTSSGGGTLAFGGLPSAEQVPRSQTFLSTPLVVIEQYVEKYGQEYNTTSLHYAIDVEGISYSAEPTGPLQTSTPFDAIVDTGTSLRKCSCHAQAEGERLC